MPQDKHQPLPCFCNTSSPHAPRPAFSAPQEQTGTAAGTVSVYWRVEGWWWRSPQVLMSWVVR